MSTGNGLEAGILNLAIDLLRPVASDITGSGSSGSLTENYHLSYTLFL